MDRGRLNRTWMEALQKDTNFQDLRPDYGLQLSGMTNRIYVSHTQIWDNKLNWLQKKKKSSLSFIGVLPLISKVNVLYVLTKIQFMLRKKKLRHTSS